MSQINVSVNTLRRWYEHGISRGAVAMTIMTDTFPERPEQYPEYEIPGEDWIPRESMQVAGRTFSLQRPLREQMPCPHEQPFMECHCVGPCGCG